MMATTAHAQPVHDIHVTSDASKITHISLYPGRAEVTRLFKIPVLAGQNKVIISTLATALDPQSFKVRGQGDAVIHDVVVSGPLHAKHKPKSDILTTLYLEKEWLTNALSRRTKALLAADAFLDTLNAQHLDFAQLGRVMETYDAVSEKLSVRITDLRRRLREVEEEIEEQEGRLEGEDAKLGIIVAIGVFAANAGQVKLVLTYAVRSANWDAVYEIRVDMNEKDSPVTLIYKAAITQNTGENWENVPLTLETATPTSGLSIPALRPWFLSWTDKYARYRSPSQTGPSGLGVQYRGTGHYGIENEQLEWDDQCDIQHQETTVTSKGNVSASLKVPGLITVPSSGQGTVHNVIIAQMTLAAEMSWVAVPKVDFGAVHLEAKIRNVSEYTLFPGNASLYVDGGFIARSNIPAVSPQESFHCPLGLDPSIRITYHPRMKLVSHHRAGLLSGYSSMATHNFSQRITVHNTKTVPLEKEQLKIIDQIPVTTDEHIMIKLLNPPLISPGDRNSISGPDSVPEPVKVNEGVIAQWQGADDLEEGRDPSVLGKDGKLYWLCAVPAKGNVDLSLEWEVTVPVGEGNVGGL